MISICTRCWTSCDVDSFTDDLADEDWTYLDKEESASSCCRSDTIEIDQEELEDIAQDIENNCFTFDQAFEKHGSIAYFIAENLIFLQGYDEV